MVKEADVLTDSNKAVLNDILEYCKYYNLPVNHIVEVMRDPKVVPMIRGKAFEYGVCDRLKAILSDQWQVENPRINAQAEIQDIDVQVTHLPTDKIIAIECKLAAKDRFRIHSAKEAYAQVKCMRSRTVGTKAAAALARRYGIATEHVTRHADNYRADDFHFVVASLGNAFWRNSPTGEYVFSPTDIEMGFLRRFFRNSGLGLEQLKDLTFNYLIIAPTTKITVTQQNGIVCVRKDCKKARTHHDCGFVPNYPIVPLHDTQVWTPIENAENLFIDFVS